jgi:tetratricopeptide (TPR) repeat protein
MKALTKRLLLQFTLCALLLQVGNADAIAGTTKQLREPSSGQQSLETSNLVSAGYKLLAAGSYETAARYFSQALNADPSDVSARRYLAIALIEDGLPAQGAQQMQAVIQSGQPKELDYYYLGKADFYCANYSRSIENYQQALKINPNLELAKAGLAHAYAVSGKRQYAIQLCEERLRSSRDSELRKEYENLLQTLTRCGQKNSVTPDS